MIKVTYRALGQEVRIIAHSVNASPHGSHLLGICDRAVCFDIQAADLVEIKTFKPRKKSKA